MIFYRIVKKYLNDVLWYTMLYSMPGVLSTIPRIGTLYWGYINNVLKMFGDAISPIC